MHKRPWHIECFQYSSASCKASVATSILDLTMLCSYVSFDPSGRSQPLLHHKLYLSMGQCLGGTLRVLNVTVITCNV